MGLENYEELEFFGKTATFYEVEGEIKLGGYTSSIGNSSKMPTLDEIKNHRDYLNAIIDKMENFKID